MAGVAAGSLGEPGGDDGGDVVGDRAGQPFPGSGGGVLARLAGAVTGPGDDVGGGAGHGRAVVDAAELGHPLAAVLLTRGQPGGQLAAGAGGGPGGGRAERLRAHRDALAVELHDQQHAAGGGRRAARGIERVHVSGRRDRELLGLPLADPHSGGAEEGLAGLLAGAADGLDRGQPRQPV
jgi:hypothetical protein